MGDPYTFSFTFESEAPGQVFTGFTQYTGTATFTSIENASDLTATARISDAPNLISISIEPPDTTLFQLEFTNIPGEFREPSRISIVLAFGGADSEDIKDYLGLELPSDTAISSRRVEIPFSGIGAILGSVDSVESSSPVPSGGAPWLLLPAIGIVGAAFAARRGRGPVS